MNWEVLIIPLIALGVWVLSTIFSRAEDERQKQRAARRPDEAARVPVPPRAQTDIDRFLEEARQRRRQPRSEDAPPMVADPVPRPPAPAPRPRAEGDRPRPAPAEPRPPRRPPEPAAAPAAPPAPMPAPPSAGAATIAPAPPPTPPTLRKSPTSPVLKKFVAMLADRDALKAALVLREVFDRPVSQRRL